jgi:hypothetical protein
MHRIVGSDYGAVLPRELKKALTTAELALNESRHGHLDVEVRRKVWDAMGPYHFDTEGFACGTGHLRRCTLSCLTAEAALGVWKLRGGDHEPESVVSLVESYLAGQAAPEHVWEAAEALFSRADNMCEGPDAWVVLAVQHAVNVAFSDELAPFEELQTSSEELSEYDAGYYTACAIAGGHPGAPESSIERRRQFWSWYLQSAVPVAFQIAG